MMDALEHIKKTTTMVIKHLRNNCIVFEDLPVSIGDLTVENGVLFDDGKSSNKLLLFQL
jgi:hypothetical protein